MLTNIDLSVIINSTKNKTPYQTSTPPFSMKETRNLHKKNGKGTDKKIESERY